MLLSLPERNVHTSQLYRIPTHSSTTATVFCSSPSMETPLAKATNQLLLPHPIDTVRLCFMQLPWSSWDYPSIVSQPRSPPETEGLIPQLPLLHSQESINGPVCCQFYFPNIFVQRTPDFSVEYSTWTGINREQFGAIVLEKLAILINNSIHFKFHSLLKIIFMIKMIHHTRNNYFHSQNSHFFILNLLAMLSLLLKHTILLTILQSH